VRKAASAATNKAKQTISGSATRSRTNQATSRSRGASAARTRNVGRPHKTRAELYEMAKRKDIPGRSRMRRDELARKLGEP
jgi:hypothetical protein